MLDVTSEKNRPNTVLKPERNTRRPALGTRTRSLRLPARHANISPRGCRQHISTPRQPHAEPSTQAMEEVSKRQCLEFMTRTSRCVIVDGTLSLPRKV